MRSLSVSWALLGLIVAAVLWTGLGQAQAFPSPSPFPKTWEFTFTNSHPELIAVPDSDGQAHWYWFMAYKVVNNTGTERMFVPEVTIATNEGDIIQAGRNVPGKVFAAVKERLGNKLLESPVKIMGRILQGEDFARESVAIWPMPNHTIRQMTVFISGLSGESQLIKNPLTDQDVLVSKTLALDFDTPGHPATPQNVAIVPGATRWVMR